MTSVTYAQTEDGRFLPYETDIGDDVGKTSSGPPPIRYQGVGLSEENPRIDGLPTRADLVRRDDKRNLTKTIAAGIQAGKPVMFMPISTKEVNEYVAGSPVYKLHLFGVLPNGAKAHLILDKVDVYFDVRVPDHVKNTEDFRSHLRQHLFGKNIVVERSENIKGLPIRGFRTQKVDWVRLYFPTTQIRKRAIKAVREMSYETASDDLSNYFRMVARVYNIPLTDWGYFADCEYYRGGAHPDGPSESRGAPRSPLCEHVFRVDIKNFRPFIDQTASEEEQERRQQAKWKSDSLSRDRTLVMAWDIETYDSARSGDLPLAKDPNTKVFMICITFHWKDETRALYRVCLVDIDTEPDKRWATVVCGSESCLIEAFALVYRHFAPDIITGFNDGQYDWPFVLKKAETHSLLAFMMKTMTALPYGKVTEEEVLKWNVQRDKKIKITAEKSALVTLLDIPGCVPVDTRIMFMQLHPKEDVIYGKSSLNFYLKLNNLSSKADMEFNDMWDAYERRDAAKMRIVAHYCVVDANRCQELLVRRNIINDRREIATLSYVNLYDAVFYAGGHKVCNLLAAHACRENMMCSSIADRDKERSKYPGAFVFPPKKGMVPDPTLKDTIELEKAREEFIELAKSNPGVKIRQELATTRVLEALKSYHPGRPGTGLDFASLYPSIIMTYNYSPEKFVEDESDAQRLKRLGYDLKYVEFPFSGRLVRGWFVRHEGKAENYGLFARILIKLFNARSKMKIGLVVQEEYKEHMELLMARVKKQGKDSFPEILKSEIAAQTEVTEKLAAEVKALTARGAKTDRIKHVKREAATAARNVEYMKKLFEGLDEISSKSLYQALQKRYDAACFLYAAIDAKQKGLKVFMNTFYGETGNNISPFFLLQLAGGVTKSGRDNLKMVADFVLGLGYEIKYGDTDSLYLCCPESSFEEVDKLYAFGKITKEEHWTRMVRITMDELGDLRDKVNQRLREDNGTGHLRMAYEEVLYPVVFTGKKKYYGIAHVNVPNFYPKKLFIRGIDVVKKGQAELARKIGMRTMWASVDLNNKRALLQIVLDVLKDAVENGKQWAFDDFIQSAAWKPNKANQAVQRFMARMKVRIVEEEAANKRRVGRGLNPLKSVYYVPPPGARFEFVLVTPGASFSLEGLKSNPKTGDVMEYVEAAKMHGMEVDVPQYLTRYVIGLCARFVNSDPLFLPPNSGNMTEKAVDEKSQKAAKKYLGVYLAGLRNADPRMMLKRGYAYKRAWKNASRECRARLREKIGPASEVLHGDMLEWKIFLPSAANESVEMLASRARSVAENDFDVRAFAAGFARRVGIDKDGSDIDGAVRSSPASVARTTNRLYDVASYLSPRVRTKGARDALSLHGAILVELERRERAKRTKLASLAVKLGPAALEYEAHLTHAVSQWRKREHEERPTDLGEFCAELVPTDEEYVEYEPAGEVLDDLREAHRLWLSLVGIYRARACHRALVDYLDLLKNRRLRRDTRPDPEEMRRELASSLEKLPPLGLDPIGNGGY
jgi:DNA polymerase elongation subunit (family B)